MKIGIKEWLQSIVELQPNHEPQRFAYQGTMDVVIAHGIEWSGFSSLEFSQGEIGQCFYNAQRLMLEEPTLTYVEGFAMSRIIPIHHGWCVDASGKVIDITWGHREDSTYFGVPIRRRYISHIWSTTEHAAAVFDNWVSDPPQPILLGRHEPSRWLQQWPIPRRKAG